jgi:uncharacterized delta-60 repeat protein
LRRPGRGKQLQIEFVLTPTFAQQLTFDGFGLFGLSALAYMNATLNPNTVVVFNKNVTWGIGDINPGGFDIQTIASHELGHVLGIKGDTRRSSPTIMDYDWVAGANYYTRTLYPEDIAELLRLGYRVQLPGAPAPLAIQTPTSFSVSVAPASSKKLYIDLVASGGVPGYGWSLLAPPPGMSASNYTFFPWGALEITHTTLNPIATGSHTFQVSVTDAALTTSTGNITVDIVTDTVPPTFGGVAAATATGPTSATLSWAPATDNVSPEEDIQYFVYLKDAVSGTYDFTFYLKQGTNTGVELTKLLPGTTYSFIVRAEDGAGNQDSNLIERTITTSATPSVPGAPTALAASPVSPNSIGLSWQDNLNNENGFIIERSTDGVTFSQVTSLNANATSFSDLGLTASTQYYYKIKAFNSTGESGYSNTASATTPPAVIPPWAKAYDTNSTTGTDRNDYGGEIRQTSDGGYILCGSTTAFVGDSDAWIVKLNADGTVAWQVLCGGPNFGRPSSIKQTGDGGYIVAADSRLLKLDSAGTVTWHKYYSTSEGLAIESIVQTSDGGYAVAGWGDAFGPNNRNAFAMKLNSDGSVAWAKQYVGTSTDYVYWIDQTSDGGYVLGGNTTSFGAGWQDAWVLKLNSDGTVAWQKRYANSGPPDTYDYADSIRQTTDGGYILAGSTRSGSFNANVWVAKLNTDGTVGWQKSYAGASDDYARTVQQTGDGGYIVAGYTASFGAGATDIWLLKLNGDGTIAWERSYGGTSSESDSNDSGTWVQQTSDGGYVVSGTTNSFGANLTYWNAWVFKTDSTGAIAFSSTGGASSSNTTATVTNTTATVTDTTATISNLTVTISTDSTSTTPTNATVQTQAP